MTRRLSRKCAIESRTTRALCGSIAVVGSSWKISRLNVVAAVRDIPDVPRSPRRRLRTLVWAGLLIVAGALLTLLGQSATNAFSFYGGHQSMADIDFLDIRRTTVGRTTTQKLFEAKATLPRVFAR